MFDLSRPALGYVWIGILQRPFYSVKKIRRGKNKGKVMVEYRCGMLKTKKEPMEESSLRWLKDYPMPTPSEKAEEFDDYKPVVSVRSRHKKHSQMEIFDLASVAKVSPKNFKV